MAGGDRDLRPGLGRRLAARRVPRMRCGRRLPRHRCDGADPRAAARAQDHGCAGGVRRRGAAVRGRPARRALRGKRPGPPHRRSPRRRARHQRNARDAQRINPLPPLPPTSHPRLDNTNDSDNANDSGDSDKPSRQTDRRRRRGIARRERRGSPSQTVDAALTQAGLSAADVAALATSIDIKADEPGILATPPSSAAGHSSLPPRRGALAKIEVPNPSEVVHAAAGTPSVAEAAARQPAPGHEPGRLLVPKTRSTREYPMATAAVAEHEAHPPASAPEPTPAAAKSPPPPDREPASNSPIRPPLFFRVPDHQRASDVPRPSAAVSSVPDRERAPDVPPLWTSRVTSAAVSSVPDREPASNAPRLAAAAPAGPDHQGASLIPPAARRPSPSARSAATRATEDGGAAHDVVSETSPATAVPVPAARDGDAVVRDRHPGASLRSIRVSAGGRLAVIGLGPGARDPDRSSRSWRSCAPPRSLSGSISTSIRFATCCRAERFASRPPVSGPRSSGPAVRWTLRAPGTAWR